MGGGATYTKMNIVTVIAGFLSGVIASMGMGGGAVLLIYLVVFAGAEQLAAQGINLAFFIPIGILSIIIYAKKGKSASKPLQSGLNKKLFRAIMYFVFLCRRKGDFHLC